MSYLETPDGVRLRLCDRGDGARAFVLLHGWKQSHRLWDRVVPLLDREFRVVAFDLRGMGESDKPGDPYTFAELADDLAFVLGGTQPQTSVARDEQVTVDVEGDGIGELPEALVQQ
jgi:pimeloyl-ACP methyl ester carboxylesterase